MVQLGLLGKNIGYSLSPRLHTLFFNLASIEGSYKLFDTKDQDDEWSYIESVLNEVKSGKINGINITIPYKEAIIGYIDEVEPEAKEIGAVNTITLENGKLKGYNTDYLGVLETFKRMELEISGKKIYILGAGGSAKAVAKAVLISGGVPMIVSRSLKKIEFGSGDSIEVISYEELEKIQKGILLINTTPLGNNNNIEQSPVSKEMAMRFENIFDLNYNPVKTKIMNYVKTSENGLYMLVVQGLCSEMIWNRGKIALHEIEVKKIAERIYLKLMKELLRKDG